MECSDLIELQKQLQEGTLVDSHYSIQNGLLMYKNKLMISKDSKLKTLLHQEFHETPTGRHAGVEKTYLRLSANFF